MASVLPLETFWSGQLALSSAFADLRGWAAAVHTPPLESLQSPPSTDHVREAAHKLGRADTVLPTPDVVTPVLETVQDRRRYCGGLLRLCIDQILGNLSGEGVRPAGASPIREWLADVNDVLKQYNMELTTLRWRLSEAERVHEIPRHAADWILQVAERLYTRLWRSHAQITHVTNLLDAPLTPQSSREIQRRLSWVLGLQEFSCEINWEETLVGWMTRIPKLQNRIDVGAILLRHFHPNATADEIGLFERAAESTVRHRHLAFDLDKTLGDTYERFTAQTEIERRPDRYDVAFDDMAHQFTRMRIPYRGMQAMLLGLWAAGNHLRLYTASENGPDNHEAFFNDFPLFKVAFGIVPPEKAGDFVAREVLHASPYYMDARKRREFGQRHLESADGRLFVEHLKTESGIRNLGYIKDSKIPFPDFPFDVLIDDLAPTYYTGELQTMGFGRRAIDAPGDAQKTLASLESYFASPLLGISPTVREWLREPSRLADRT